MVSRSVARYLGGGSVLAVACVVNYRIGTAGWTVPPGHGGEGTHLQRYSRCFNVVELNSSFYRPHQRKTYARWADSVPPEFRFSVKLPKLMTHERRLRRCRLEAMDFLDQVSGLKEKLEVLLVQLPPSLEFERRCAAAFFRLFSGLGGAQIVCEPRHLSWFAPRADDMLEELRVARAAADPAIVAAAASAGGHREFAYYRLHGSPKMYYSSYPPHFLAAVADCMAARSRAGRSTWCIFDNTAARAAWSNASDLQNQLVPTS